MRFVFRGGMRLRFRQTHWIWYFTLGFARINEKNQKTSVFPKRNLEHQKQKERIDNNQNTLPRRDRWPRPPCKSLWHDTAKIYLGCITNTHILSSQVIRMKREI